MTMVKAFTLLFLLSLGGSSCSRHEKKPAEAIQKAKHEFFISQEGLKKLQSFDYRSHLEIEIGKDGKTKTSIEDVQIIGDGKFLLFKKALDKYHFFEYMSDGDSLVVKNQYQAWRKDADGHFFEKLLDDAFNLVLWLNTNLALDGKLSKVQNGSMTKFSVDNQPLSKDASLLKLVPEALLTSVKDSRVFAEIDVDQNTKLPRVAQFFVEVLGKDQSFIKIKASVAMNDNKQVLSWPQVSTEENSMPVNLSSRFKELLQRNK